MSNIWWSADLHFGHDNVLMHTNRPWKTVREMDDALIENWNKTVKKGDTVYVIGDFAFQNHAVYCKLLNGSVILFKGSHDEMNVESYRGFKDVMREEFVKINGDWFFCDHCPHRNWERGHYGVPMLFGHHHGRVETFNMSFDVGVDTKLSNYFPIPHDIVLVEVERRREMMRSAGRIKTEKFPNGNEKVLYQQDDVIFWQNKYYALLNEAKK